MSKNGTNWEQLARIDDSRLLAARGQLHQAVQLLTAVGISFVEPRPDDSHTSLLWNPETKEFLSQAFGPDQHFQLGLNPGNLDCRIIHNQETLLELSLHGSTLEQIASDLQFFLEDHGLPKSAFTMKRHYELPDYPDHWQSPFDTSDLDAFGQLASAYANTNVLIANIVKNEKRASSQLTWPHHFDMATLLTLGEGKSIGVGMSPGDTSYTAPYYYVNAWPYPTENQIKDKSLTFGKWHTEGWTGMVLPLDQISQEEDPSAQQSMVRSFLQQALQYANSFSQADH